jgi:hypothetical protein
MSGRQTRGPHDIYEWGTGEEQTFNPESLDAVPLQEIIEDKLDNPPKDKRSKEYKEWKITINELMKVYNKKVSFSAYQLL